MRVCESASVHACVRAYLFVQHDSIENGQYICKTSENCTELIPKSYKCIRIASMISGNLSLRIVRSRIRKIRLAAHYHQNVNELQLPDAELLAYLEKLGRGRRVAERCTFDRRDRGSKPPAAISKLRQLRSLHFSCVFRKRH